MNGFFSMDGRLGRAGYIWRTLGITVAMYGVTFVMGMVMGFSGASEDMAGVVGFLVGVVATVVVAFQAVKRLHDMGRPGSHYWFFFIPLFNIYMGFLLLFEKGTEGSNAYGSDPVS